MTDERKTSRFQATVAPDGKIRVPVSRKTKKQLDRLRNPGESDDDVMRRIMGPPRGVTSAASLAPITEEDQNKLDMALRIKGGSLKPVGLDEKVKLSKDPLHPTQFVVVKKSDIADTDQTIDPDQAGVDLGIATGALSTEGNFIDNVSNTNLGGEIGAGVFGAAKTRVIRQLTMAEQIRRNVRNEAATIGGAFIDPKVAEWMAARSRLLNATSNLEAARDKLTNAEAQVLIARSNAAVEFVRKIDLAPILQKVGESGFHDCVAAWRSGEILVPGDTRVMPESIRQAVGVNPTIFVIQHDWAAAFAKAQEFAEGEYRIPYAEAVYEFRISGARVIACVATEDDIPHSCILNVKTPVGWITAGFYQMNHGRWEAASLFVMPERRQADHIMAMCAAQIRAVAIALDAEVAETVMIRAPHKLNMKRERKGRLPLYDYHVIDLSNRKRYAPLPPDPNREVHHRRLHFVRGHWRHYSSSKTWIRWHMRGDPDLGFIDKEYRL